MNRLAFWKMHGAGNDFILFDDRSPSVPSDNRAWLAAIASRRTGVGCEGIILLQNADEADVRMRFFNPDGRPAEMCGNGARCAARLAYDLGMAGANMTLVTDAGLIRAAVEDASVRLDLTAPQDVVPQQDLELAGQTLSIGRANTGVPHVVLEVDRVDEVEVVETGRAIRHQRLFEPAGTNVNFVQQLAPGLLAMRTYERGVEAETGACGTGAVAAAIIMAARGHVHSPVRTTTRSGDTLTVAFRHEGTRFSGVTLTGPDVYVYQGQLAASA